MLIPHFVGFTLDSQSKQLKNADELEMDLTAAAVTIFCAEPCGRVAWPPAMPLDRFEPQEV
jgi:hypothetical protein